MSDNYARTVRKIVKLAREEARASGSEFIGTEHVLLGILQLPGTFASQILTSLNIDIAKTRKALKNVPVQSIGAASVEGIACTPRCRRAFAAAKEFSAQWKEAQVSPEHVLLGLLYERECNAARVLSRQGVGIDDVGQMIADWKKKRQPPPPGGTR